MDIDAYLTEVFVKTGPRDEKGLPEIPTPHGLFAPFMAAQARALENSRDLFKTAREAHALQILFKAQGHKNLKTIGSTRGDLMGVYNIIYGLDKSVDAATSRSAEQLSLFERDVTEIARKFIAEEQATQRAIK